MESCFNGISIIRPIRHLSKNSLFEYAARHQLAYSKDITNQDLSYDRNLIRHLMKPLLSFGLPSLDMHLDQLCQNVASVADGLGDAFFLDFIQDGGASRF